MTLRLDLFGFVVADMARSLDFYRMLGLPLPENAEAEPHVELELPTGLRLAWDTVDVIRSFSPEWTPPIGGQRIAPAFLCDSPAEVNETVAALTAAGYEVLHEPWDAFWGQRYATVLDPDGNPVDIFAPLPDQPAS